LATIISNLRSDSIPDLSTENVDCDNIKLGILMKTTKILIADDHPVFRTGVRELLDRENDMEIIGEAKDGEEAVSMARELKPDVVVMDIIMPNLNGIEATKQIKTALPGAAVLLLSGYDYESYVLAALKAGAAGFVSKEARSSELLNAIRTVQVGERMLDQTIAYKILSRLISTDEGTPRVVLDELHKRELEVLRLAAKGMSNKDIAQELVISERTVQSHFANIFRKLDVGSRVEAVIRALKQGWFSLDDL
jgi:DNA-binding NarL/FixJ family response regulator